MSGHITHDEADDLPEWRDIDAKPTTVTVVTVGPVDAGAIIDALAGGGGLCSAWRSEDPAEYARARAATSTEHGRAWWTEEADRAESKAAKKGKDWRPLWWSIREWMP